MIENGEAGCRLSGLLEKFAPSKTHGPTKLPFSSHLRKSSPSVERILVQISFLTFVNKLNNPRRGPTKSYNAAMNRSRLLCLAALSGITLMTSPLHAQFVDMFNGTATADATNYTYAVSFGSGGVTFGINGSQQFQPTTSTFGTTTQFYRDDSTLNAGNTVSVEIDNIGDFSAAGLAFATSTSGANFKELSINPGAFSGGVAGATLTNGSNTSSFDVDFAAGSILETVTRTSDTTLTFSFSGPGLTDGTTPDGPITGTLTDASFAGQHLVFGLDTYSGNSPGQQIEDNLTFVPEPSTWALMFGGVAMLASIIRLRAARFARD